MSRVAVLGAGSWGTALAVHLGRVGHAVALWSRDPALAAEVGSRRANSVYLPDVVLPETVSITATLADALRDTDVVVSAVPSHGCRSVLRAAATHIRPGATVVSATKGLESDTLLRMSQVITQELGNERSVVVLSGPSFAVEVARKLPTVVLAASEDQRAID